MMNKLLGLFSAGFLAVLLAGCFNPVEAIPPNQDDLTIEPFTLDVLIGKDAEDGRSIAGPDAARIKGTGIRNIIQLIVADKEGKIVAFDEVRRERDDEEAALLRIDSIAFGQTYHFLLLMGHWERDYDAEKNAEDGKYQYTADPPTLLAAGLKEQEIKGSGKVTVTMWPIEVDTVFTAGGGLNLAPEITDRKPGKVTLHPADWSVTWTIKRGSSGNGLTDLVKAQKIRTADAGETLLLRESSTMVRDEDEDEEWEDPADLSGNVITRSIGTYTSGFGNIGKEGSVNFKLEYVPFNLTNGAVWTPYDDDSDFDLDGKPPVWIIRNGVNDKAQDGETDFNIAKNPGMEAANWNGAAAFVVAADSPAQGELVIKDGVFVGPWTAKTPYISFTAEGYEGTAEAYYAVVPGGTVPAPAYSAYTGNLGVFGEGEDHLAEVTLSAAKGDFDVYVVLFKDGKVSTPIKINTGAGGEDVDWIWGDEPYTSFYVASTGDDEKAGTKEAPLLTVEKALAKLADAYAADASWPNKKASDEANGGIIILDTVDVTEQITITNIDSIYPPIILGSEGTPGGKLQAQGSIGSGNSLLRLQNNVRVTLDSGLILAGTGIAEDNIRGVVVTGASTFTMNGGEISGNSVTDATATATAINYAEGGGVYVDDAAAFIMNDGVISGNTATATIATNYARAGGVHVTSASTFTMNGGEISGNTAAAAAAAASPFNSFAGGINVTNASTFTMNGGVISGNTSDNASGVHVGIGCTFTMKGGEISGNTATSVSGTGGVYIAAGESGIPSKFEKTGGIIYGIDEYDADNPASKGNNGNAVWVRSSTTASTIYRKEATSGPEDILRYNYPSKEDIGWDE
jgi:hypothetical protein